MRTRPLKMCASKPGGGERGWLADTLLAVVVIVLCATFAGDRVGAATSRPGNLTVLEKGQDRWVNYDFLSEETYGDNVDWPMTVIFYNNATINRTKEKVEAWGNDFDGNSTNGMHTKFRWENVTGDGWLGWVWDKDRGKKTPACPSNVPGVRDWSPHYRVYSPMRNGRESLYNPSWGYWNVASTHKDWYECGGNKLFERPELVENFLVAEVDENTTTASDVVWFHNHEPYRMEGNHLWTGNGYASKIRIP